MTTGTPLLAEPGSAPPLRLTRGSLPRWAPAGLFAASLGTALLVMLLTSFNWYGWGALTFLLYVAVITAVSRRVEGSRRSTDRLVTALVFTAFALALLPLLALVWTVLRRGVPGLTFEFLTTTMRGVIGAGGGVEHAIVGTLLVTGLAALISVPIGLLTAIYLVEYSGGRLGRWVTLMVDVMTGIPSIVAGLFAYALFEIFFGPGVRMGAAGSVALSVLMIPFVVRSSEEMLRLVPAELREASYALGIAKWRTVVKVVIPTAVAGLTTGVTLAVARVIGETAPLLLVAGLTTSMNTDPFHDRMTTLPVYAFSAFATPGFPPEAGYQRAWSAALVLIILVMLLNLIARLVSRFFGPRTGR
jgi:phosphate transport system permease protein